ncbi:methylated-DNA--[protein]-cysteine S-methyltransferase [Herbaspirillum sp. RV1423]|uniref:methylated-DNA--[protein]-cysteine S-methyltransferase n=1 Tax=Herbaspirillum sp. RV1423 TaxID=1443993 RepID=UPI0004B44C48|nr:methylated-DNA--[protein]-cysteine S-methyltransferase [Herbaspirillum sp. RV1423]
MKAQAGDIFSAIVHVPFGAVGIRTSAGVLQEMVYLPKHFREKDATDALADKAAKQVLCYIEKPDYRFRLPLAEVGSEFQRKVWAAISSIPSGEVRTYGQIAKFIQSAPRAVGQACGANWFPLVVPCHRVTASGGIGGFSHHDSEDCFHIGVKRWLLAHEGVDGY